MSSVDADTLDVWGVPLPRKRLDESEREYLSGLPAQVPTHEWVCAELDRVWHAFGLDNRMALAAQPIDDFYRHPVWLMVGIFSAADPTSAGHRAAIATRISEFSPRRVADMGGGFGELALRISEALPSARVEIVERYPSAVAEARLQQAAHDVSFVPDLEPRSYDVVVAQDVLEHVEEPIELAIELAQSVRPGGTVIFANAFVPIIECHLPGTFHLLSTFPLVMRALGLTPRGCVAGAEHALLFEVPTRLHPQRARRAARVSRAAEPITSAALAARNRAGRLKTRLRAT